MIPRRYLTPKTKAALRQQQGKHCANCRGPLGLFNCHADHQNPLWCTGTNDADNWQLLCGLCHARKTHREAAARAKTKRLENVRLHGIKQPKGRPM